MIAEKLWKRRYIFKNFKHCQFSYQERHGIKRVITAKRYAAVLQCKPEELLEF